MKNVFVATATSGFRFLPLSSSVLLPEVKFLSAKNVGEVRTNLTAQAEVVNYRSLVQSRKSELRFFGEGHDQ